MAHYTEEETEMERISESGAKWEWQFSVALHIRVMFSITGFQEGEGFSLLATKPQQHETNDRTCAHAHFICRYRLTPALVFPLHPSTSHFYASLLTNWTFWRPVLTPYFLFVFFFCFFLIHTPAPETLLHCFSDDSVAAARRGVCVFCCSLGRRRGRGGTDPDRRFPGSLAAGRLGGGDPRKSPRLPHQHPVTSAFILSTWHSSWPGPLPQENLFSSAMSQYLEEQGKTLLS